MLVVHVYRTCFAYVSLRAAHADSKKCIFLSLSRCPGMPSRVILGYDPNLKLSQRYHFVVWCACPEVTFLLVCLSVCKYTLSVRQLLVLHFDLFCGQVYARNTLLLLAGGECGWASQPRKGRKKVMRCWFADLINPFKFVQM